MAHIISRRGLLGMFAAGSAAAIIRTPALLMPVKPLRLGMTDEQRARYLEKMVNPPMLAFESGELTPSLYSDGNVISFPAVGEEIVYKKSLWRVTWSTGPQFGISP